MDKKILALSFLIIIGLVGTAENGGSMLILLWLIPLVIIDAIILYVDYEKGNA